VNSFLAENFAVARLCHFAQRCAALRAGEGTLDLAVGLVPNQLPLLHVWNERGGWNMLVIACCSANGRLGCK
jgi:hypothetical protein